MFNFKFLFLQPNAEDLAREVLESESVNAELLRKRKTSAERRGQDALLRERVRRDYQTLLQNLDHLSREERKLKASQVHEPLVTNSYQRIISYSLLVEICLKLIIRR